MKSGLFNKASFYREQFLSRPKEGLLVRASKYTEIQQCEDNSQLVLPPLPKEGEFHPVNEPTVADEMPNIDTIKNRLAYIEQIVQAQELESGFAEQSLENQIIEKSVEETEQIPVDNENAPLVIATGDEDFENEQNGIDNLDSENELETEETFCETENQLDTDTECQNQNEEVDFDENEVAESQTDNADNNDTICYDENLVTQATLSDENVSFDELNSSIDENQEPEQSDENQAEQDFTETESTQSDEKEIPHQNLYEDGEDLEELECVDDQIAEDVADTETDEVTEDVADTETDEVTEDVANAESDEVTEDVADTETDEVAEDVADTETDEVTEDVADTETDEVTEDVADTETDEVTEDVADTETDEVAEDVADTETDEIAEDVANAESDENEEQVDENQPLEKKDYLDDIDEISSEVTNIAIDEEVFDNFLNVINSKFHFSKSALLLFIPEECQFLVASSIGFDEETEEKLMIDLKFDNIYKILASQKSLYKTRDTDNFDNIAQIISQTDATNADFQLWIPFVYSSRIIGILFATNIEQAKELQPEFIGALELVGRFNGATLYNLYQGFTLLQDDEEDTTEEVAIAEPEVDNIVEEESAETESDVEVNEEDTTEEIAIAEPEVDNIVEEEPAETEFNVEINEEDIAEEIAIAEPEVDNIAEEESAETESNVEINEESTKQTEDINLSFGDSFNISGSESDLNLSDSIMIDESLIENNVEQDEIEPEISLPENDKNETIENESIVESEPEEVATLDAEVNQENDVESDLIIEEKTIENQENHLQYEFDTKYNNILEIIGDLTKAGLNFSITKVQISNLEIIKSEVEDFTMQKFANDIIEVTRNILGEDSFAEVIADSQMFVVLPNAEKEEGEAAMAMIEEKIISMSNEAYKMKTELEFTTVAVDNFEQADYSILLHELV